MCVLPKTQMREAEDEHPHSDDSYSGVNSTTGGVHMRQGLAIKGPQWCRQCSSQQLHGMKDGDTVAHRRWQQKQTHCPVTYHKYHNNSNRNNLLQKDVDEEEEAL